MSLLRTSGAPGRSTLAAFAAVLAISATDLAAQAPATSRVPALSADALMATVRTLASEEYQGRAVGTEGGAKARAFIRDRFVKIGLKSIGASYEYPFSYTPKGPDPGVRSTPQGRGVNLVGRCGGSDPALPAIVLSAHYDHQGIRDGRLFPGADDNASGVAAMLAIAEQCVALPFRHDIIVAAFDAEESGLNGAQAFVAAPPMAKSRIALNVNLDMVARGDKGEIYIAGTRHSPPLRPLLEPVAARAPIRALFGHDVPGSGHDDWTMQSDHGPFHAAGIPFVYFGVEDHPDYHQPSDTADKINPDFFVKAAAVILDALRALDAGI
jgi:Zn-dependent M28 family amino/carboxypeptidase